MKQEVATQQNTLATISPDIISSIVTTGDLSKLSPQQKTEYYNYRCQQAGLDPSATPFSLLKLNGKEMLYAKAEATQQLMGIHKLSDQITSKGFESGLYVVCCKVSSPDGRSSENLAAVATDNLKGEQLANAMMKATTKAKRRTVLAHLGLGMLDETEVETIPGVVILPVQQIDPAEIQIVVDEIHNSETPEKLIEIINSIPSELVDAVPIQGAINAVTESFITEAIGALPNQPEPIVFAQKQVDFIKKAPKFRKAVKDCETALNNLPN